MMGTEGDSVMREPTEPDNGETCVESRAAVGDRLRPVIEKLKVEVAALQAEPPRNEIVVRTARNVSARVDLLVIKPSEVSYDDLSAESMVACDFDVRLVEDVAQTVQIARQGGDLVRINKSDIDRLFDRYQNVYGQCGGGISEPAAPANQVAPT
jgi:hypothetical protein